MENLNSRRNDPLLGMNHPIGKYGRMLEYLRQCHPDLYQQLILQGTLNQYLSEANDRAQRMMDSLIRDMILQEDVTEQMKAADPLMWTARMNSIRDRAEEIVMEEVVRAL